MYDEREVGKSLLKNYRQNNKLLLSLALHDIYTERIVEPINFHFNTMGGVWKACQMPVEF